MPRGRKKSDVSREEKLLKKREAERQRRALRKNDPELREEDRIKEHLRYIQRKNDLLKDLNERDRRAKRKKLKENLAAFRLRQKVLDQALRNTPPPSPPQPTPARPYSSDGGRSRQEAGRRRIKRNRSKIYREYERLKKHNKSLQQAKERYRKQLDRLRTKLEQQKFLSPNTKVNQLLKKDTPENRREVRRKLVFAETTEQQLTYSYKNLKKQKHKQAFVKLIGETF
ncbi:hypothetical protein GE061_000263 [Apolygus lucorum]|uniref:Uncharacterized protein n=1 Tax=Apolygus lucorum TaxID=248454 RepID=A0A8S9Y3V9_APOLU|nr:hypothetical protein GE061_000263 [Apolygus lucorum]